MLELRDGDNFQIGRALAKTYRQWASLEQRKKTGVKVVDIDVAPTNVKSQPGITNRRQVEVRLLQIAIAVDKSRTDGQYLSAKASSSFAFVQALRRGDPLPWEEYIEVANGILPQEVPQHTIRRQHDLSRDIFKTLGHNLDPEGWANFFREARMGAPEFEASFKETEGKAVPVVLEALGMPFLIKYRTKTEKSDKPWLNWITGDRSGFVLKINTHPNLQSGWYRGNSETLAIHEVCGHIVQASMLRKSIDRNIVNPGYGIMTIPGPEQWGAEGIAVTLPYLVRPLLDVLTDFGRFSLEYRLLRYMVEGNALIDLNRENPLPESEVIQRIQHYLPNRSHENVKKFLDEARHDPVYRAYHRDYEDGSSYFRRVSDELSESDIISLLQTFYTQPMTPRQIKEWVWQHKNGSLSHASA